MPPYCPRCGGEMSFIQQYQRHYCFACQAYGEMPPQPVPPSPHVQFQSAPVALTPDANRARARMHDSMALRQVSDVPVKGYWAGIIFLVQLVVPISAVLVLLALFTDISIETETEVFIAGAIAILAATIVYLIVQAALVYKLVNLRDEHFRRDRMLTTGMMEYLDAVSVDQKLDLNVERWTMNTAFLSSEEYDRSAVLWAALVCLMAVIPLFGVLFLIYTALFLTKDVQAHDDRQRVLASQFAAGMRKVGSPTGPPVWNPLPRRDPIIYVFLTIITLGMFLPYWWYVNITDMRTHLNNQWAFEKWLDKATGPEG